MITFWSPPKSFVTPSSSRLTSWQQKSIRLNTLHVSICKPFVFHLRKHSMVGTLQLKSSSGKRNHGADDEMDIVFMKPEDEIFYEVPFLTIQLSIFSVICLPSCFLTMLNFTQLCSWQFCVPLNTAHLTPPEVSCRTICFWDNSMTHRIIVFVTYFIIIPWPRDKPMFFIFTCTFKSLSHGTYFFSKLTLPKLTSRLHS